MGKRIWNEEELRSSDKFYLGEYGWESTEIKSIYIITSEMIGKDVDSISRFTIEDWMIAKEPKQESKIEFVDSPARTINLNGNTLSTNNLEINQNNMETKKVTLNNGTVLEVGGKYTCIDFVNKRYVVVLCIDCEEFFGKMSDGINGIFSTKIDWLPYTPLVPQKEWKTFLIENTFEDIPYRYFQQHFNVENARKCNQYATKITEVKVNIELVNN